MAAAIPPFLLAAKPFLTTDTTLATPSIPDVAVAAHYEAAYQELRRIARAQLNQHQRSDGLDTTALVHESFMRFSQANSADIVDKRHFLSYAAKVMRSVIVDAARSRNAERRGGDMQQTTLNSEILENVTLEEGVIRIDDVIELLQAADPQLAQIVELRFFAGLSVGEAAEVMGISERSLYREWEKARLILIDAIRADG